MAGRISEYLTTPKIELTDLMDLSVVDGGSPSGYVTRKTDVNEFLNFHPSLYTDSGTLLSNRTVDQDGNNIYFSGGDFGLDFINDGFKYEDLTKRIGIGNNTPLASVHIQGQSGDDLFLVENSVGNDRFKITEDGQIGTGSGTNASTAVATFGQWHQSRDFATGFAYYGSTNTSTVVNVQHTGSGLNRTCLSTSFQGSPTGTATGISASSIAVAPAINIGLSGNCRNGVTQAVAVDGLISGGGSVNPSQYATGIRGRTTPNLDTTVFGGFFSSSQTGFTGVYTKETVGVQGVATENTISNNSTAKVIGGKFFTSTSGGGATLTKHMAINVPSTGNDGVVVFGKDVADGDSVLQTDGKIRFENLPIASAGLLSGELWNDAGTLKIA